MMRAGDWQRMAADLAAVRDDNAVTVSIRRGAVTLPAQSVRIARAGTIAQRSDSGGLEQSSGRVVVVGDTALDIAIGDRFNVGGDLYQVDFVRPNRRAMTVAEARLVA
jgi:hypothetical protein